MNARMLTRDEQRLIQHGLAQLHERAADQLYGKLHETNGKRLILVNIHDEPLDQSEEVPG